MPGAPSYQATRSRWVTGPLRCHGGELQSVAGRGDEPRREGEGDAPTAFEVDERRVVRPGEQSVPGAGAAGLVDLAVCHARIEAWPFEKRGHRTCCE